MEPCAVRQPRCLHQLWPAATHCDVQRAGFTGDGFSCQRRRRVPLCTSATAWSTAHCVNEAGAYECACDAGFSGAGGVRGAAGSGCRRCRRVRGGRGWRATRTRPVPQRALATTAATCRAGYTRATGCSATTLDECSRRQTHACDPVRRLATDSGGLVRSAPAWPRVHGRRAVACADVDDCASAPCRRGQLRSTPAWTSSSCACARTGGPGRRAPGTSTSARAPGVAHQLPGSTRACVNTVGSWVCTCNLGWRADHHVQRSAAGLCVDVDECGDGTHGCGVDKLSCVNAAWQLRVRVRRRVRPLEPAHTTARAARAPARHSRPPSWFPRQSCFPVPWGQVHGRDG